MQMQTPPSTYKQLKKSQTGKHRPSFNTFKYSMLAETDVNPEENKNPENPTSRIPHTCKKTSKMIIILFNKTVTSQNPTTQKAIN